VYFFYKVIVSVRVDPYTDYIGISKQIVEVSQCFLVSVNEYSPTRVMLIPVIQSIPPPPVVIITEDKEIIILIFYAVIW
jgi:hypothetical protein